MFLPLLPSAAPVMGCHNESSTLVSYIFFCHTDHLYVSLITSINHLLVPPVLLLPNSSILKILLHYTHIPLLHMPKPSQPWSPNLLPCATILIIIHSAWPVSTSAFLLPLSPASHVALDMSFLLPLPPVSSP